MHDERQQAGGLLSNISHKQVRSAQKFSNFGRRRCPSHHRHRPRSDGCPSHLAGTDSTAETQDLSWRFRASFGVWKSDDLVDICGILWPRPKKAPSLHRAAVGVCICTSTWEALRLQPYQAPRQPMPCPFLGAIPTGSLVSIQH